MARETAANRRKKLIEFLAPQTAAEKFLAKRVANGVELLDKATPGWFTPINPATLHINNRQSCVFAQAGHQFAKGITTIVDAARGAKVRGIKTLVLQKGGKWERLDRFVKEGQAPVDEITGLRDMPTGAEVIDVFHYGVDLEADVSTRIWQSAGGAMRKGFYGRGPLQADFYGRETTGEFLRKNWMPRREVWTVLEKLWARVVTAKKKGTL